MVRVSYPLLLSNHSDSVTIDPPEPSIEVEPVELTEPNYPLVPRTVGDGAWSGQYAEIRRAISEGRLDHAQTQANDFVQHSPGQLLPLLTLGEVAEAAKDYSRAIRAYGTIFEQFLDNPQVRWLVGQRLGRLATPQARILSQTIFDRTLPLLDSPILERREFAYAWVKAGQVERAFDLLKRLLRKHREEEVAALLERDVTLLARVLVARAPSSRKRITTELSEFRLKPETNPSILFSLTSPWSNPPLELSVYATDEKKRFQGRPLRFADTGNLAYVVDGERQAPYTLRVRAVDSTSVDKGPLIGQVQIIALDATGHLTVEERPFVIRHTPSEVDLGQYGALPEGPRSPD
jgi:hypothetical protein